MNVIAVNFQKKVKTQPVKTFPTVRELDAKLIEMVRIVAEIKALSESRSLVEDQTPNQLSLPVQKEPQTFECDRCLRSLEPQGISREFPL